MSLFDRYVMVDWSANNTPTTGNDSIWIAIADRVNDRVSLRVSLNPSTRRQAMDGIADLLLEGLSEGRRTIVGFDFPFGYPRGGAEAMSGQADWLSLWRRLQSLIVDGADNRSNRFEVAGRLNREAFGGEGPYWGRPASLPIDDLKPTKPASASVIPEKRLCEQRARSSQPVWKLCYPGSVGSQALLGIKHLCDLRDDPRLAGKLTVWPFETRFGDDLSAPCVLAEIYPSVFPIQVDPSRCKDQVQVETLALGFANLDAEGRLQTLLDRPSDVSAEDASSILAEEGWILGLGHSFAEPQPTKPIQLVYQRDPAAIYAQSFATIRAEADLSRLAPEAEDLAIRLVHACGMVDLLDDLIVSPGAVEAGRMALTRGAPILCDAEMVTHGVIARNLTAGNMVLCRLNDLRVPSLAAASATTRSAAQVDLWDADLHGAVVAIGNAPTALFRLLERLDAGAPKPAVILGLPVGFVGAAESKAELARDSRGVPFVTVRGRRGGSAMAAAAVNALASGLAGGLAREPIGGLK